MNDQAPPRKGDQIGISYVLEGRAYYDDELNHANVEEHYHENALAQLGKAYARVNAVQLVDFQVHYQGEIAHFETRDAAEFFCMRAKPPIPFEQILKRVELTLG